MGSWEESRDQQSAIETQVLTLTLAGAKDLEVCKSLRISQDHLSEIWNELQTRHDHSDRCQVIRYAFGEAAAALWKSKQDIETRLREEIFDRETEQALLNDITLITNTGGWSMELATGQIVWTQGINSILGRPLDAPPLAPKEVQALVHPEDQPTHRRAVERLLTEGTVFHLTYRMVIDGEIKNIRSATRAHFDEQGKLLRIFGTITDETEILKLRDSEMTGKRMLESIATLLPDTAYVFDTEAQTTVYSNRNVAASLGYSPSEAQEMGPGIPTALLHPGDRVAFEAFRENIESLGDRETRGMEVRLRHVDSRWMVYILAQVVFQRNAQGKVKQVLTTMHEITDLRASQKALVESEDMLARGFQDAPLGMAIISLDGTYEKVNPAYAAIAGYEIDDLVGKNILLVNDPQEVSLYVDYLCDAMSDAKMPPYRREMQTIRKDGTRVCVYVVCSILRDDEGRAVRTISQIQDISAAKQAAALEREGDRRLQTTIDSLSAGVMFVVKEGYVSIVNPAAAGILKIPLGQLQGIGIDNAPWILSDAEGTPLRAKERPVFRALAGETVPPTELKLRTSNGEESWIKVSCSPLYKAEQTEPYAAVLTFMDVTAEMESRSLLNDSLNRLNELNQVLEIHQDDLEMQKIHLVEANIHLAQLATTDELTGLRNSRRSKEYLEERVQEAVRYGRPLSVAMIDVDHFKLLNDEHGHLTGDRVLREVAAILERSVRNTDFVGRYGGEEFLAIMPEVGIAGALVAAERLRFAVEERLKDPYGVTISVGVTTYPPGTSANGEELLRLADLALYKSKRKGRNLVTANPEVRKSRAA